MMNLTNHLDLMDQIFILNIPQYMAGATGMANTAMAVLLFPAEF